jgi:beta-mannosidase
MGDGRYAVTIRTRRFAVAVAIAVESCLPDDNYFHLTPGAEKTVVFVRQGVGPGRPQGWLHALNGRSAVRLALGANPAESRQIGSGKERAP